MPRLSKEMKPVVEAREVANAVNYINAAIAALEQAQSIKACPKRESAIFRLHDSLGYLQDEE